MTIPTPDTPESVTALTRERLTPQDALEEMDSTIKVSRAYQQVGESCAEIDPDMIKCWRMAFAPLVMRDQAQAAEIARLSAAAEDRDALRSEIIEAAYQAWPDAEDVGYDARHIIGQLAAERDEARSMAARACERAISCEDTRKKAEARANLAEVERDQLTAKVRRLQIVNAKSNYLVARAETDSIIVEDFLFDQGGPLPKIWKRCKAAEAMGRDLADEMIRARDLLDTFIREHTDPGADAFASLYCMGVLINKARTAGLLPVGAPAAQADPPPLVFGYTNWQGEYAIRRAVPIQVYHGSTEWHPEPQWLMEAHDVDKGVVRVFAIADMRPVIASEGATTTRFQRSDSDPHNVQACQHPDCGRFQDGAGWSCRAMAEGACARPGGQQAYSRPEGGER